MMSKSLYILSVQQSFALEVKTPLVGCTPVVPGTIVQPATACAFRRIPSSVAIVADISRAAPVPPRQNHPKRERGGEGIDKWNRTLSRQPSQMTQSRISSERPVSGGDNDNQPTRCCRDGASHPPNRWAHRTGLRFARPEGCWIGGQQQRQWLGEAVRLLSTQIEQATATVARGSRRRESSVSHLGWRYHPNY